MAFPSLDEQISVLTRGCERIDTLDELRKKIERSIASGKPLRAKLGLDPTAPDIHLGHTVVLRKLRQFQDLGHKAVLIIGDYTAMVGDPSGRSKTRPVLGMEQIKKNAQTYFDQAGQVLDTSPEKLEVRYNSEWLGPMTFADVLKLAGQMTVGQMLKREDFRNRFESETPIGVHELMYPLMQGYDSVMIHADVELGGTDQTFNNLVGRDLQKNAGQSPQIVITMPILVGLDGVQKMSKSLGNYVGVTESAHDMFGKLMSVPDPCMANYLTLLTDTATDKIMTYCDTKKTHPMDAKKKLGHKVICGFHGHEAALQAQQEWEAIHQKKASTGELVVPADTPTITLPSDAVIDGMIAVLKLIVSSGFAASNGEARRLVEEGGIRINGEAINDALGKVAVKSGDILQRGKRKFVRIDIG